MASSDLFFSEYVEGSGFNKAVEIFNGTGAVIDLAAAGYTLELYSNGAVSASASVSLTGNLADGDVFVAANGAADASILAASDLISNAVINFNGDDAVVLRRNGVIVDVIGQIGNDPGTEWGIGLTSTQDNTIRRLSSVTDGDTDGSNAFDPGTEWEGFALNTLDGLGSHSVDGGGGDTPGITVVPSGSGTAVTENGATDTFTLVLDSQPAAEVVITITPDAESDVGGGTGLAVVRVFTPDNWDIAQFVAVRASDDGVDENPDQHGSTISFSVASDDADYSGLPIAPLAVTVTDADIDLTLISTVQGSGTASALDGQLVTIRAVVVGDFQNGDGDLSRSTGGFFLQEEDADADGDAATSEGLFVFDNLFGVDVNIGDVVTVTGTVDEFNGFTELTSVTSVSVVASGATLPTAAVLDLSGSGTVTAANGEVLPDLEAYEGMLVSFAETLTITEMFNLDRFNEVRLTEGGRLDTFTQNNAPDAAGYAAFLQAVGRLSITYDDGSNVQNQGISGLDGFEGFTTATAPSMGDTISGLTGVLEYAFNDWRVRSVAEGSVTVTDSNPADLTVPEVGGDLKVASLNVLNFFTTLNAGGALTDTGLGPRGANTVDEYARQLNKLVNTLAEIDADVVSLIEIENAEESEAVAALVAALNAKVGAGTYAFVNTGLVGSDAITSAFLYKTATVAVEGAAAILDTPEFLDPFGASTPLSQYNRPAIAQTFTELASGESFTAVVNHLKSKSSGTGAAADEDQGDGQGLSSATRLAAALELAAWLETNPTGDTSGNTLLLGDYNAYAMEDPVQALLDAGFSDLAKDFLGEEAYSYVFDGLTGTLDYAFSNEEMLSLVYDVVEWHINSDEADALDYNLDFGRDPLIFDPESPLRTSDHDPVILGLSLSGNVDLLSERGQRDFVDDYARFDRALADAATDGLLRVTDAGAVGDFGALRVEVDALTIVAGEPVSGELLLAEGVVKLNLVGEADILVMGSSDANRVNGGSGDNQLFGALGDDRLFGNHGADVLAGGADRDVLFGGAGGDRFVMLDGAGQDIVADFDVTGLDRIDLSQIEGVTGDTWTDYARTSVRGTVFDFGDGDILRLRDVRLSDLSTDLFVFAAEV